MWFWRYSGGRTDRHTDKHILITIYFRINDVTHRYVLQVFDVIILYLETTVDVDQYVFWFNITMNNSERMNVFQS